MQLTLDEAGEALDVAQKFEIAFGAGTAKRRAPFIWIG